jgi:hypothetical protein
MDITENVLTEVMQSLENSILAIDDWVRTYASELCDEEKVKEAESRIMNNGGTLYYAAVTQKTNREALQKLKDLMEPF